MNKTQYTAGPPTSYRAALSNVANFSGTAVTLNGGQDFLLHNVTILGFDLCVRIQYNQRPVFDHLYGDCTYGLVADSIYDVAKWRDMEMFPAILSYGNSIPGGTGDLAFTFTGITNNGGQYCLTGVSTSSVLTPATGDTIYITGAGGATGANGRFTITVNGSGCNPGILLVGSVVSPTPTATVTVGNQWVKLSSTPTQWVYWNGQTVSDSASANLMPAGATIDQVWIGSNLIHITKFLPIQAHPIH